MREYRRVFNKFMSTVATILTRILNREVSNEEVDWDVDKENCNWFAVKIDGRYTLYIYFKFYVDWNDTGVTWYASIESASIFDRKTRNWIDLD